MRVLCIHGNVVHGGWLRSVDELRVCVPLLSWLFVNCDLRDRERLLRIGDCEEMGVDEGRFVHVQNLNPSNVLVPQVVIDGIVNAKLGLPLQSERLVLVVVRTGLRVSILAPLVSSLNWQSRRFLQGRRRRVIACLLEKLVIELICSSL